MRAAVRSVIATLVLAVTSAGCAGSQKPGAKVYPGNPEASPSMEVLPATDVPKSRFTERMRFAWLLSSESFDVEIPVAPLRPTVTEIQSWADTELEDWLEKKNEMVEAARAELDAAAEEGHRQRIIAGALVGLMYEDVARVLLDVPVPRELESEPEIAEIYREIIEFQATPYIEHAKRAYRACALNAARPASMRHWSGFCATRRDQLPAIEGDEGTGQGETVVTVQVER